MTRGFGIAMVILLLLVLALALALVPATSADVQYPPGWGQSPNLVDAWVKGRTLGLQQQQVRGQRETCFLAHEFASGLNRICIYDCVSGQAAITVGVTQLCPLTIHR